MHNRVFQPKNFKLYSIDSSFQTERIPLFSGNKEPGLWEKRKEGNEVFWVLRKPIARCVVDFLPIQTVVKFICQERLAELDGLEYYKVIANNGIGYLEKSKVVFYELEEDDNLE